MTIAELNEQPTDKKQELLSHCCGATTWVNEMLKGFPFSDEASLLETAEAKWQQCTEADWLEAFTHHPKIGDISSLREKFASTAKWAEGEQASVKDSSEAILQQLSKGNKEYEDKFGFIFIVCATGKSAEEMLALLKSRLPNEREQEVRIAAAEQAKITQLRLKKLLS
jgi:2-oxo-4-hydroxy-4-carboxy-5-ureidoimidazoline decarboxylase